MPDWTPLRRRAQNLHRQLCAPERLLTPADALLERAEQESGLSCVGLPTGDPLLAEAHGVLDRAKEVVWFSNTLPPERRRLILAHEFAHYWLHPDLSSDICRTEETLDALFAAESGSDTQQIAFGYSPAERREVEANLFAAELLLPSPLLRRLFVEEGWSASRIAREAGVPEGIALSQLIHAVLLPPSETILEEPPSEPSTFVPFPLDDSQERAAKSEQCPLLVEAGPGTGKTRTLISRLQWLLTEKGVAPENILALTFSNRAAEEMRTRLRNAVGAQAERVWIGTFHAFGFELLRKEGRALGLPLTPQLLETADAILLLERHLERLNLDEYRYLHQPSLAFSDILRCISRAKDELLTPEHYLRAAQTQLAGAQNEAEERTGRRALEAAHLYTVYQTLLEEYGLLDFGDLIMRAVQLLDSLPEVRARWQAQYPHVLADEYQDINRASAQMLRRLVGEGKGFWAVGDVRQAIYQFRGASPANIREFERDFPNGTRLRLEVNYRSRPALVDLFSGVASQMEAEEPTQWEARRAQGDLPTLLLALAEDEEAQADGIAAQIRAWEAQGVSKREQAILCRTNRQAGDLAQMLEARGIPTLYLGNIFERPEIKDLLALLSFACEPHGASLVRVAQFPEYSLPAGDVPLLFQAVEGEARPFPYALESLMGLETLSEQGRVGLQRLWAQIQPLLSRGDAWLFWTRYLFERSDYLRPLLKESRFSSQQKCLAIFQLLQFAQGLTRKLPPKEGETQQSAFLAYLRHLLQHHEERSVKTPESVTALDGVRLMTMHASKGLEFPVVYLPNLVQSEFSQGKRPSMAQLPPLTSPDGEPILEEERGDDRLFFVALSRARESLLLSHTGKWRGSAAQPAALLANIHERLLDCGVRFVTWVNPTLPEVTPVAPALSSTAPNVEKVSVAALEQFQTCPRRYYYQRVARLPAKTEVSPYRVFYGSLSKAADWIREERIAGRTPSLEAALEVWEAAWEASAPAETNAHHALLQAQARPMVAHLQAQASEREFAPERFFETELAGVKASVFCDHAETHDTKTLRLVQYKRGRPKDDDHRAPELALLRKAASEQHPDKKIEISLLYLESGEEKPVAHKATFENRRILKLESAARELQASDFPPAPNDRNCPTCPFLFLCPA